MQHSSALHLPPLPLQVYTVQSPLMQSKTGFPTIALPSDLAQLKCPGKHPFQIRYQNSSKLLQDSGQNDFWRCIEHYKCHISKPKCKGGSLVYYSGQAGKATKTRIRPNKNPFESLQSNPSGYGWINLCLNCS